MKWKILSWWALIKSWSHSPCGSWVDYGLQVGQQTWVCWAYGHYGINVQQGAVTIPADILWEKALCHQLSDPFWLFSFPKRGLHPSPGVRYPSSPPRPGPILLCYLARENPPNKQWSGTRGVSETPQKITRKNNFSKRNLQRHCSRHTCWQQRLPDPHVSVQTQHTFRKIYLLHFLQFLQCRMTSSEISTPEGLFLLYYWRCTSLPTRAALHHNSATISSSSTAQQLLKGRKGCKLEFHYTFKVTDHWLNGFQK